MEAIEVLGLEHLDLTVSDLERSSESYQKVLTALGFRRLRDDADIRWANAHMTVALRPASARERGSRFDRYRTGLHHVAFKAIRRASVDRFHRFLVEAGLPVLDPPAEYPQYGAAYYALFFADPDGIKLELAHFPWGYWKTAQQVGKDARPRYWNKS